MQKNTCQSPVIQAYLPQSTPGYSKLKWTETFGIQNKRKSNRRIIKTTVTRRKEKRKKPIDYVTEE